MKKPIACDHIDIKNLRLTDTEEHPTHNTYDRLRQTEDCARFQRPFPGPPSWDKCVYLHCYQLPTFIALINVSLSCLKSSDDSGVPLITLPKSLVTIVNNVRISCWACNPSPPRQIHSSTTLLMDSLMCLQKIILFYLGRHIHSPIFSVGQSYALLSRWNPAWSGEESTFFLSSSQLVRILV